MVSLWVPPVQNGNRPRDGRKSSCPVPGRDRLPDAGMAHSPQCANDLPVTMAVVVRSRMV